jgi:hypothetical protein
MTLPADLKALLRIQNRSGGSKHPEGLFPAIPEILELFNYNDTFPALFQQLNLMPYRQIDCDFAWEVINRASGEIIQIDLERNNAFLIHSSLEKLIEGYLNALKLFPKDGTKEQKAGEGLQDDEFKRYCIKEGISYKDKRVPKTIMKNIGEFMSEISNQMIVQRISFPFALLV